MYFYAEIIQCFKKYGSMQGYFSGKTQNHVFGIDCSVTGPGLLT